MTLGPSQKLIPLVSNPFGNAGVILLDRRFLGQITPFLGFHRAACRRRDVSKKNLPAPSCTSSNMTASSEKYPKQPVTCASASKSDTETQLELRTVVGRDFPSPPTFTGSSISD